MSDPVLDRRSIRKYTDQPVPDKLVETLLRAAMSAPSAGNQQPWHFVVIRDRAILEAVPGFHPYSRMMVKAPVAILVCGMPGHVIPFALLPVGYPAESKKPSHRYHEERVHHDTW